MIIWIENIGKIQHLFYTLIARLRPRFLFLKRLFQRIKSRTQFLLIALYNCRYTTQPLTFSGVSNPKAYQDYFRAPRGRSLCFPILRLWLGVP